MTARVLVVDDLQPNLKLLETRLDIEYFEVLTATNGPDAIAICEQGGCDLVLLDVMIPGMNGLEVCRRLRAGSKTAHLPIILVTALDRPADRVRGLEAGADDFLTKPVDEIALIARVRSLARLKFTIDELRNRAAHSAATGVVESGDALKPDASLRGRILLVDDQRSSLERMSKALARHHDVIPIDEPGEALAKAANEYVDLMIVSLGLAAFDPLRQLGVNDYLSRPVDRNELLTRARSNIRQKRYMDRLRQTVRRSVGMALYDPLTGLNNRRFLERRLPAMIDAARERAAPLTMMILDIDHFKRINDTYGHEAGDHVLKDFAAELRQIVRGGDLLCRLDGEEFVVAMPGVDAVHATRMAERARRAIENTEFPIRAARGSVAITVSIGLADLHGEQDSSELYRRADRALYLSKSEGRNRVTVDAT
jgi:two-component system cell cycle response regulator